MSAASGEAAAPGVPADVPAGVPVLRNRDFLKLWGGQTVSEVGNSVSQLALPLVAILTLNASAFEVGALNAAERAPFLLVALSAGVLVDRWYRRPVLITADVGRAVLLATIPLAFALGALTIWQLYAVALVVGVLTVFFDVAYQSYLPALVSRAQLAEGNAKLTMTEAGARVVGPGIGGGLVSLVGAATAVLADAVSFVVSVVSVLAIRTAEPRHPVVAKADRPRMRDEIREGLGYVLRHPMLSRIAACTGTSNFGSGIAGAVLALYLVRQLGWSAGLLGGVLMVGALGAVAGAALTARINALFGVGRAIVGSALLSGLGYFLYPLATHAISVPLVVVGEFVVGFCVPVYNVGQVSLRQAITPDRLLGRMNASMRFVVWGTIPVGGLLGGGLGEWVGLRPTLVVGAVLASLCVVPLLGSPVPGLRTIPTEAVEMA